VNVDDEAAAGSNSRARWLGVVLILVALAALVWQAWLSGVGDELKPAAVQLGPVGKPSLGEMLGSVDSTQLGAQAASAAALAAAAASVPLAPGETEICGLGRVKADDAGQPKDMAPIRLVAQRARERLLPALANSADEPARAAGLLLQSAGRPRPADESCDSADCPPRDAPINNPGAHLRTDLVARDALASMALNTRSPQVYAFAMAACQGHRKDGVCLQLSPEQWARLDPDNAVPWLHVAADARDRRDASATAEALFRVSRVSRSDAHWGGLTSLVLARLPADLPILDKVALASEVLALESALPPPFVPVSQYCSAAEVRDANRQQTCADVAEVLVNKGSSLIDVALGASIGQRVGWPAERLSALQDERDAIAQLGEQAAPAHPWSCAVLARTLNHLLGVGQHGELVTMRRALRQSPEPVAVLAGKHREAVARRVASAASSPASNPVQ
jgi:hypothetical protein